MESTPIYRWWKRNTLSLLETILAIDSNRKNLNCWFKGVIMVCQNRLLKLVMLATIGGAAAVIRTVGQQDLL
jgi:hypothetical protein